MARPLGGQFHISHGLSIAMLLPICTQFSIYGALQKYAAVAKIVGCAPQGSTAEVAANSVVEFLKHLNKTLQIPNPKVAMISMPTCDHTRRTEWTRISG